MNRSILHSSRFLSFPLLLVAACSGTGPAADATGSSETASALDTTRRTHDHDRVFVESNEADNAVLVFTAPDRGALRAMGRVSTGGHGSGDGLGSQGALATSGDGRWLLAVNAGSDQVSLLRVTREGLSLASVAPSGGDRPISVTESHGLVYVLNAGATQNVSGFTIDADAGKLRPITGSARALSADTNVGAAEVLFSPDGDALVVTEKGTNTLDSFVVRRDGTLTNVHATPSVGDTPFGFAFDPAGTLIVSDAFGGAPGKGAVSSYRLDLGAAPSVVTGPAGDAQGAPCWVVATRDGRFAYTSNTASGTVSGYTIAAGGSLTLFGEGGITATTGDGSKPTDMVLDDEGSLLYVLDSGTAALGVYQVASDGTLAPAGTASGLPAHAVGLATTSR